MKLVVEKSAILEGLQRVQPIVSTKSTLPVLANILFKAEGESLWLSATDLDVSVRTAVPANISKEGATTLPARRIGGIMRELPSHDIEMTVDNHDLAAIKSGSSFFKLVGISDEDFPPIPAFEGEQRYTLEQGVFREMLHKTAYAASTEETRYILNGVLLSFKGDKLTMVATDGRRLALVEQEVEFPHEAEADLVIPSKTVNELLRTLGDEGQVKIQVVANQVAFEFGPMLIVSKLVDGTYPNFRQVIPGACEERITLEREALFTAVKRVALIASEQSSTTRLTFGKNELEIVAETADVGEARETLPIQYSGKEISVAFNPEYLMDPLRNLDGDEVYLELTNDLSPALLKCDVPFLYVLMPVRVS